MALVAGAAGYPSAHAEPQVPSASPPESRLPATGDFDLPAQPVSDALLKFCLKSGCSFSLLSEDAAQLRSTALDGVYAWEDALRTLLSGTGLAYERIGADAIRVFDVAAISPQEAIDTVTVWGVYSRNAQTGLEIEREADRIVDAVSAARIGEFPAANVAEALQRVPGVAISREAGEGQFVSVRGLGPLFQAVTLNGAPIAFNENIRNSDQSGRQFQFRVIPPDLISGLVLTKSPTADLSEGGVGSTIDIRTARPLEVDPFFAARGFGHHEERTAAVTPNGFMLGAWRNDAETLGLVGGLSYQARDVQFDRFQLFGYTDHLIDGAPVSVPNEIVLTVEREERQRLSMMGGAQWRLTDRLSVSLEALYSVFWNDIIEDRVSFQWGGRNDLGARLVPGSAVVRRGVLVAGELSGGEVVRHAEFSDQTHDSLLALLKADQQAGPWKLSSSLSYSSARSRLDTPLQRIDGRTEDADPRLTYSYAFGDDPIRDRRIASVQTSLDLRDPSSTDFYRFRVRPTDSGDVDHTALLDVDRSMAVAVAGISLDRFMLGGQVTDRRRNYQRRDRTLSLKNEAGFDPVAATNRVSPADAFDTSVANRTPAWASYDDATFAAAFERLAHRLQ